jgi:hypothetical protein
MAYIQNEDELKQGGAGGQVLAGSGGAAGASPTQAVGSGFTNLQKYLSANQGSGQGVAQDIVDQGQDAVNVARTTADTQAKTWGDNGVQMANQAAADASNPYTTAAQALQADPNANITNPYTSTYGGPQSAQDVQGYNDLDKAYQNVKNTATSFANDRMTQQAGLQKKYGYGSGFAALDGFLGRQDGRDKIQGWAAGVNPGSAAAEAARVNQAIAAGKDSVAGAQKGFADANAAAKKARSSVEQVPTTGGRGIADKVNDPWEDDMDKQNKQTGGFRLSGG